jgi:hypothetical protein
MSRKRPRIDGFILLLAGGRSSAQEAVICGDCGIDLVASEYATLNEVDIAIGVSLSERARQCQHHLCMRCLAMAHANRGAELTVRCGCGCKSPSWIIHARWQRGQIRDEVQRIVAPTEYHERCRHPHLFFQNTSAVYRQDYSILSLTTRSDSDATETLTFTAELRNDGNHGEIDVPSRKAWYVLVLFCTSVLCRMVTNMQQLNRPTQAPELLQKLKLMIHQYYVRLSIAWLLVDRL